MKLEALKIPEKKVKQLEKAGFKSVEQLYGTFPKKYLDRSFITGIRPSQEESVLFVQIRSVEYKGAGNHADLVIVTCEDCSNGAFIQALFFNQSFRYRELYGNRGKQMLLAGKAVFTPAAYGKPDHYAFHNPVTFAPADSGPLRIYPVYKRVAGMAAAYYENCVARAAKLLGPQKETLPQAVLDQYHLMPTPNMMLQLHNPTSMAELKEAQRRQIWDDLIYFALRIELNYLGTAKGSPFSLLSLQTMTDIRNGLPFALTDDQDNCIRACIQWLRDGKRLNALIQGDVGCGKTIIAVLLMIAFAENGYQAAIMAPTQILAKQHYDYISELCAPYGIQTAFVSGAKLRKTEQAKLEAGLRDGTYQIIVGTQALLSDTYQFQNLALVIEDEEHKYGVIQRKALSDKAAQGTNIITMSATPIPRTLAQTIYGDNIQLFQIKSKPAGRLPVRTGIQPNVDRIHRFLLNEVRTGHRQAYVICPMVAPSEKVEGVATAEQTYEQYRAALEPYGVTVGLVTGKTPKAEAAQILDDFTANHIHVLVSTTVIEVGVNVPNASTIVIHNAERFGLAQLHQLRGRVGRGSSQGWCILVSDDISNERLTTLCNHSDGFTIAEMDLKLRGAGDLIGIQQSGTERFLASALCHPAEYSSAQVIARDLLQNGTTCPMVTRAIEDHQRNICGEMME